MSEIQYRKDGVYRVDDDGNETEVEAVQRHKISSETVKELDNAETVDDLKDVLLDIFGKT